MVTIDPCISPREFIDLADGTYNFTVAAVDGVGNEDPTPALMDMDCRQDSSRYHYRLGYRR